MYRKEGCETGTVWPLSNGGPEIQFRSGREPELNRKPF